MKATRTRGGSRTKKDQRGVEETKVLRKNLERQVERLTLQLSDLEEFRSDLADDEYTTIRDDTLEQLREFNKTLEKMVAGDFTLVDKFGAMQLAIRATIEDAFKAPDVIALFAKSNGKGLHNKFQNLLRDMKLKKIDESTFKAYGTEVIVALQKLGETLVPEEQMFMDKYQKSAERLVKVVGELREGSKTSVLGTANASVKAASQQ